MRSDAADAPPQYMASGGGNAARKPAAAGSAHNRAQCDARCLTFSHVRGPQRKPSRKSGAAGWPIPPAAAAGALAMPKRALSRAWVVHPVHRLTHRWEGEGSEQFPAAKEHDSAVGFRNL